MRKKRDLINSWLDEPKWFDHQTLLLPVLIQRALEFVSKKYFDAKYYQMFVLLQNVAFDSIKAKLVHSQIKISIKVGFPRGIKACLR